MATPLDMGVIPNVHNLSKVHLQAVLKDRGISPLNKSKSALKAYALLFNKKFIRKINLSVASEDKAPNTPVLEIPVSNKETRTHVTVKQDNAPITAQEKTYDLTPWRIKYNGVSDVLDFIDRIEETASIKNVPFDVLQKNFIELISPELIPWHRIQKSKCKDWNKLRSALITSFGKSEAQHRIKLSLLSIKQLVNETVATFIERAESINIKLSHPVSEAELLPVITDGLLQRYENIITSQKIVSLAHLNEVCLILESHQDRKNNKTTTDNITVPSRPSGLKPEFDNKKVCSFCKKVGHLATTCFKQAKFLEAKEPRTLKRHRSRDRSPPRDELREIFKRSRNNMERLQDPHFVKPQVDFSKPPPNFHARKPKN